MRITIRTCWAVLTLALLAPVGQATAQTFDEIARKAAERRKTATTYTRDEPGDKWPAPRHCPRNKSSCHQD